MAVRTAASVAATAAMVAKHIATDTAIAMALETVRLKNVVAEDVEAAKAAAATTAIEKEGLRYTIKEQYLS